MEIDWVEWFGYLASMVVLISLTMSSIIKLRVINLIGSLLFASFAYLIDSIPTIFMNLSIAVINLYYLWQIHYNKEQFKLITAEKNSEYLQHFISVNRIDIEKQVSLPGLQAAASCFYMLRDNNIAGVLAGTIDKEGVFTIVLDYVVPKYRDFKLGHYYYHSHPEFIKAKGVKILKTSAQDAEHCYYLQKMGFVQQSESDPHTYIKRL